MITEHRSPNLPLSLQIKSPESLLSAMATQTIADYSAEYLQQHLWVRSLCICRFRSTGHTTKGRVVDLRSKSEKKKQINKQNEVGSE